MSGSDRTPQSSTDPPLEGRRALPGVRSGFYAPGRNLCGMGEVFAGRYELIDLIGEGGMGTVWRVHDRRQDTIVAAKVLRQSDAGALLRFMREQGMRIHHPHVVTPIGWAGEDDKVLFTMPAVEGGSVVDLLRRHSPLPPIYTAEVLRQLLAALAAVHEAGVIHRDVKAGNLLLEPTGIERPFVRLTDFGVAIATDAPRMTTQSMVLGTPGFIAPELMYGGDPSERSDLYAAGIVGMQMLTGIKPGTQVRKQRDDLPPRPSGTPESLWISLVRLIDPDPSGRPSCASEGLAGLQGRDLAWVAQQQVRVDRLLPPPPVAGDFTEAQIEATVYGNGEGGTARMNPVVTRGVAPVGAPPTAQPAVTRRSSSRPPTRAPRQKGVLATLVLAPLLALAAIGAVWLGPWNGSAAGPTGTANVNGVCRWQDAGTIENSQAGQPLTCQARNGDYRWVEASG